MKKTYKVKEFVYKYLETNDKESFLCDRIVCTYIPFEDKLTICEKIVDATSFNNGRYVKNTSSINVLYKLNLINLYTDIDINFGEDFLGDYNLIEEYDILTKLLGVIPENEKVRFDNMICDVTKDKEYNNCSNIAIYTSLKDTIDTTFSSILDGFLNYFESVDLNNILQKQKE